MFNFKLINEKDIYLALSLKSSKLQRESNVNVDGVHVLETLLATKWKNNRPTTVNALLTDIFAIKVEEIVAYLSTNIVVNNSKLQLNDFQDLLGGKHEVTKS